MQLVYMGFTQEAALRCFHFQRVLTQARLTNLPKVVQFTLKADMSLFTRFRIPVQEGPDIAITTADDIRNQAASRDIMIWAYNVLCPPSPGCTFPQDPPPPSSSGIGYAAVWQFAQSPRPKEFTAHCPANYAPDGNCYAPRDTTHKWFLDVNTATSPDPSAGAK